MEGSKDLAHDPVPISEVGFEGYLNEERAPNNQATTPNVLQSMEILLTRLLAAPQFNATATTAQLIQFDPDSTDADIEGWCRVTEIIVNSKKLHGAELLLVLTHALKGRAAVCLTKLDMSQLEWPLIKEMLLAKFLRPMQPQDYFDDVLRFQFTTKESASEAAMRLWGLIERIPRVEMAEDMVVGFVTSLLCQKDNFLRRELSSHTISSRSQLYRILSGVSLKRRAEHSEGHDNDVKKSRFNEARFTGVCHFCGILGHRAVDCRKRRPDISSTPKLTERPRGVFEKTQPIVCYVCGQPGHLASSCAERKGNNNAIATAKEVHLCERSPVRGELTTSSDESIPFLFDSGSACSLVTDSFSKKFQGTLHYNAVSLKGLGRSNTVCITQILSCVTIQNISVTLLFHVIPDCIISEPVIVGRDLLAQGIKVDIESDNIRFRVQKESQCKGDIGVGSFNTHYIDTDLEGEEKEALINILQKYSPFFIDGIPKRRVKTGMLRIEPIDPSKVVQRRPYRLSPVEKDIVKEKVNSLLEAGVIRESSSPFASPILLVKKKDNTDRMCVDYRELNSNTKPEHYPLPIIDEQIDRLNGAHTFSSLDMASGYHQIPIAPEGDSIARTAFVTPDGQYEYLTMPFGLRNAASVYQRCINKALGPLKDEVALAYMDDILCFAKDITQGLERLDLTLKALSEAGFSFNIHKCKFIKKEVDYLGYVIKAGEITPNPRKVQALVEAPAPKSASQVRQFLGLASYFRRFIPNYTRMVGPLYPLTKLKGPHDRARSYHF
jgi:hypothetical protein